MRLPYHKTIIAVCLLGFLICMALSLSGCASSNLGRTLNIGVVGAAVADLHSSQLAIQRGVGREGNPLMGSSVWQQGLMKAGGVGLIIAAAHLAESKQRPILAHLVRGITITAWSIVSYRNYQIAGGRR